MPVIWRIAPGQQLAYRGWDNEFVVYNDLSGDTHLLDGDAFALIEALRASPATIATLVTVCAGDVPADQLLDVTDTITALLAKLQHLFLVEPC